MSFKTSAMTAVFLVAGLVFSSAQAEITGYASGTLMDLQCYSVVNREGIDVVKMTKRVVDDDGYTKAMTLKATWQKTDGEHFAYFDVKVINWDSQGEKMQIIARSPKGNLLEVMIDESSETPGGTKSGEMKVNGELQDHLNFTCYAPVAG